MYPERAEGLGFFSLPSFSLPSFTLPSIDWSALAKGIAPVAAQALQVKAQVDAAKARQQMEAAQAAAAQRQAAADQAAMIAAMQAPRVMVPTTAPQVGVQWTGGAAPSVAVQGGNLLTQPWVFPAALVLVAGAAALLMTRNNRR